MKETLLQLSYTLDTIDNAARQFWDALHPYRIFAFSGEMGAGKTTFIHKLCDHLGVQDVVSSPTFALINEYHFDENGHDRTIYHLDWYRLKDAQEAITAGMEDCMGHARGGGAYCFVEWPEKAEELMTPPYIHVNIDTTSDTERTMEVCLVID